MVAKEVDNLLLRLDLKTLLQHSLFVLFPGDPDVNYDESVYCYTQPSKQDFSPA